MPDLKILTGFYWQSFNQLFQNNLTLVAPSKRLFCLCQVADEASFRLSLTQKKRKVTHTSSPAPSPSFYISTLRWPYCSHFHIASLPQKTLKSPPPKNTIRDRDGDSTVLYAAYTVDTVDTVDMVYMVGLDGLVILLRLLYSSSSK